MGDIRSLPIPVATPRKLASDRAVLVFEEYGIAAGKLPKGFIRMASMDHVAVLSAALRQDEPTEEELLAVLEDSPERPGA